MQFTIQEIGPDGSQQTSQYRPQTSETVLENVRLLATVKGKASDIEKLVKQSAEIGRDLREVLELLKNGKINATNHKEERLALEDQIKKLDALIKQEKIIIGQIEIGLDKNNIKQNQQDVTQATKEFSKQLAKNDPPEALETFLQRLPEVPPI